MGGSYLMKDKYSNFKLFFKYVLIMINFFLVPKLLSIQNTYSKNIARADLLEYLVDKKYSVDYTLLKIQDYINRVLNKDQDLATKYRYAIDLETYVKILSQREKEEYYDHWHRYRKYYLLLDRIKKGHITKYGDFDLEEMPTSFFKFDPDSLIRSNSERKKLLKKQFEFIVKNYNFKYPNPSWWRLLAKPRRFPLHIKNLRSPNFPTQIQRNLMRTLNNVPMFIVIDNSVKEMVIASPSWYKNRDFCDKFLEWYYNNLVWKKDVNYVHMGLIFFNPKDANLYLNSIIQQDKIGYKTYGARLFTIPLSRGYKMNRLAPPRVHMIYVPDYNELVKVITRYLNDDNIKIHPKQECSYRRSYFRGVPIYMIQPYDVTIKGYKFKNLEFTANIGENELHYPVVFFSREEADKMWREFRHFYRKNGVIVKGSYPKLVLYNLEDFLTDCENNVDLNPLFVPNSKIIDEFLPKYYNQYPEENVSSYVYQENWLTDLKYELSFIVNRIIFALKQGLKITINDGTVLSTEELQEAITHEFPSKIADTRFKAQLIKPLEREARNIQFGFFIKRRMLRDKYIANYPDSEALREYIDYIVNNKYKF
uniref:hypothetical protein n=1 Tax=Galdieria phlegrea TaxID=1389228 RepID=UPI0023D8494D|nr:hypothetical protein P2030_pgp120 [Galdieria phlegrea]WDA99819.1 hypothetical protein GAPH629S_087 [Galdieria phlegrea]